MAKPGQFHAKCNYTSYNILVEVIVLVVYPVIQGNRATHSTSHVVESKNHKHYSSFIIIFTLIFIYETLQKHFANKINKFSM